MMTSYQSGIGLSDRKYGLILTDYGFKPIEGDVVTITYFSLGQCGHFWNRVLATRCCECVNEVLHPCHFCLRRSNDQLS